MKAPLVACLIALTLPSPATAHPTAISHGGPSAERVGSMRLGEPVVLGPGARVTLVYSHPLPDLPNKSIRGVLVEYEPGGANPAHTHARSAIIYATVLEGAVRIQINGGPVQVFTRGQNFTERPGDRHDVSANASQTERASMLAVFVVDTDETELTTPLPR